MLLSSGPSIRPIFSTRSSQRLEFDEPIPARLSRSLSKNLGLDERLHLLACISIEIPVLDNGNAATGIVGLHNFMIFPKLEIGYGQLLCARPSTRIEKNVHDSTGTFGFVGTVRHDVASISGAKNAAHAAN
jgi:hypothetical protein